MPIHATVPEWLHPMSEAEREHLKLQQDMAAEKAGSMLRKQVGVARMQEQARQAMANGVDEPTARKQALLNNAELLFADNPEGLARVQQSDAAQSIRQQAAEQSRIHFEEKMQQQRAQLDETVTHHAALENLTANLNQSRTETATAKLEAAQNKLSPAALEANDLVGLKRQERALKEQLAQPEDSTPGEAARLRPKLEDVQTAIQSMEARHGEEEISVDTPGGPMVKITKGAASRKAGGPTTAETTRYGEDMTASANALRSLGQLQGQLSDQVVGAPAVLKSIVFDKVLSQLDPSFEDPARVKGRALVGISTQQIMGELNRSGRFSNIELKRIEENMPSKGVFESAARAKDLVGVLQKTLAEKGANAAVQLGRQLPAEVLHTLSGLTDEELASEVEGGFLDPGVGTKVYQFKRSQTAAKKGK